MKRQELRSARCGSKRQGAGESRNEEAIIGCEAQEKKTKDIGKDIGAVPCCRRRRKEKREGRWREGTRGIYSDGKPGDSMVE